MNSKDKYVWMLFATYQKNGVTREEFEVAGFFVFSHIRMVSYFKVRLGYLRLNDCPAGLEKWLRRG